MPWWYLRAIAGTSISYFFITRESGKKQGDRFSIGGQLVTVSCPPRKKRRYQLTGNQSPPIRLTKLKPPGTTRQSLKPTEERND